MRELIFIAGMEIPVDDYGRVSLNALHRASGEGAGKQVSNWLRLDNTKELIEELSNSSDLMSLPIETKEGRSGGTYAHELLAVSYAGWISPRFQLQVNQVFIDYKTGKVKPAQPKMGIGDKYLESAKVVEGSLKALELLGTEVIPPF